MKTSLPRLLALTALAAAASVHAADPAPPVATNLSLTTNYKYRGQDQGNNKPALQGGFDYAHSSGLYVGNWNSSIGFTNSGLEMDFYGGYKGTAGPVSYDVGVLQYYYPQKDKTTDYNTTELYGAVSFGPATGKLSYTASKKYFGFEEARGTLYFDLSANFPVGDKLTLNAHLGATRFANDAKDAAAAAGISLPNYYDYKLGATYDLGSAFTVGGHIVGANKKDVYGDINKARVILTVTKTM